MFSGPTYQVLRTGDVAAKAWAPLVQQDAGVKDGRRLDKNANVAAG